MSNRNLYSRRCSGIVKTKRVSSAVDVTVNFAAMRLSDLRGDVKA